MKNGYMRKRRLYNLTKSLFANFDYVREQYVDYKKHLGSEWLYITDKNCNKAIDVYSCNAYVSFNFYDIDDYCNLIETQRIVYSYFDNSVVLKYVRHNNSGLIKHFVFE